MPKLYLQRLYLPYYIGANTVKWLCLLSSHAEIRYVLQNPHDGSVYLIGLRPNVVSSGICPMKG